MTTIRVEILRCDADRGHDQWVEAYQVPLIAGSSVADVLKHIQEHIDGSLAFSCSCKVGLCAGCTVRVNGKPVLACATPVDGDILVEPSLGAVLRDLVVEPSDRHRRQGMDR